MADPRVLEVVLLVDPAKAGALVDPARLGSWLCSTTRVDGERTTIVVEEEYGYRRALQCRIARHDPGSMLELQVDAAHREWDGSDGTPVGPQAAAAQVPQPDLVGTTIAVTVSDEVPVLRWSGFADRATDVARREGALLRHAVDRAAREFGAATDAIRLEVERALDVPAAQAWQVIDHRDATPTWLGDAGVLRAEPGSRWSAPVVGGRVGGYVLLGVAGRRLAASWQAPGSDRAVGMLDLHLRHERGGTAFLRATLGLARNTDVEFATRWFERSTRDLAAATAAERVGA